jgi:hypothetical protein
MVMFSFSKIPPQTVIPANLNSDSGDTLPNSGEIWPESGEILQAFFF